MTEERLLTRHTGQAGKRITGWTSKLYCTLFKPMDQCGLILLKFRQQISILHDHSQVLLPVN